MRCVEYEMMFISRTDQPGFQGMSWRFRYKRALQSHPSHQFRKVFRIIASYFFTDVSHFSSFAIASSIRMIASIVVMLQALCIMVGQSASVLPTQVGSFVSAPPELQQTFPNQPADAITGIAGKYTSNFGVRETVPSLPDSPNQQFDAVVNVAEKYIPRETTSDIQSIFPAQVPQAADSLPTPYSVTRSHDGEADTEAEVGYGYYTRQLPETQSQTSAPLQNQVNQVASAVTNQTGNIDPVALTQCVYRALEQNFGRMGPILYDLITSNEGLGQDFAPITAYAAQRLGTQNIRNAVDTVVNIVNQVDWRSRVQSLFSRIGDLRDNQTGLTLQEAFQVVRNIFDDPRAYDELRQRIQDGAGQTVTASINVVDGSN